MGFKDFFKKRNSISETKLDPQVVETKSDRKISPKLKEEMITSLYDVEKLIGGANKSIAEFDKSTVECGDRYYTQGNLEEALKNYERVIGFGPNMHKIWLKKGNVLNDLGRKEEALKAYDNAIEIKPNFHEAWFNKGNVLKDLGQKEEAIKAYEKAIEIKPDKHEAWFNKGNVLYDLGRKEEALKAYEKAIEIKPDYYFAWYRKGFVLDGLGRTGEAIKAYEKAIEIKPDKHEAWFNKGNVVSYLGRKGEALKAYEKVIEIKPDKHEAWYRKGNVLYGLGRKEEALKAYEKAIEIKPDKHEAWFNKGIVLSNLGRKEEAIKAYEKAIEIKPDKHEAWFNKGIVLTNLGRREEAIKAYEEVIEIKPDYHLAWFSKGNVLFDLDKYEDAIKCYNKVKELDPETKTIEEKLVAAETKYREYSLETLKLEIKDARKYISIPDVIAEVIENGVYQKVDFARGNLKKLLSEAKPVLSVELDKTSLNLNEWYRSRIIISNEGNAHAFDVVLSFSNDFEVRRIETVSINAGDKEELEIALKPMVKGTVPLEITAKYLDGKGENYESKHAFWIDVKEFQEPEKARDLKPSSTTGAFRAVPRLFPEELAVQYKSIEYIGGGGFARVFKAKRQDEKQVAVKLPSSSDAVTGKSFINELMNWTGLEHENIVKVYEFNILPVPYFEMELCDCSLSKKQLPLDDNSSAWIIFNICEGLKYAHSKSIVHQDLKPHNILLKEGIPKISDWGLSKVATTSGTSSLGGYTPLYAAPEQISKKFGKKDVRTDIWQVGVIFYEIVTGKTPFEGDDPVMVMSSITMEEPESPSLINPEVEKLDPIIMKCLKKKQENRYQSVSELQSDLAGFLRIDYTESLRMSISRNDLRRSAFYCGELFIVHMKLGELETAYKYASDLLHYAQDDVKDITNELCTQLEVRIDNGIYDVPDELMKKAEIIVHKVGLGFRK